MKKKITEKSIELFEKKGFTQTSIQDIVDELEVTKGTFYYYFSSKEQLLMAIHLEYIDDLLERQEKIMKDERKSSVEKIRNVIALLINDIKDKGPSGRVFFREIRHLSNHNIGIIKKKRNQIRLNIEKVIRTGMDNGELRPNLKPDIITFAILSLTNYSYQWFKPNGEIHSDELVQIYADVIFNGIMEKND
ncbi:hypothetical protein J6TS1_41850 [Siminovitchia terrae]|uniref:TetR/AcrR family transcriptional regulator n=1 Tax=Siminovitchia terrae TaxID=1914933 RepID=A0A429X3A7_SIMTE|nr:TetR/AcrR family transcriptional regulator [Siminovitchia terrae]RST57854.1 TetR/AcrR family transcriptional regulator [Siminovitchia terrae]GIN98315.1 hypothetical protein J6TS1_41850 [Siminovitchia terrae]